MKKKKISKVKNVTKKKVKKYNYKEINIGTDKKKCLRYLYNEIYFKSPLEVYCYGELKSNGYNPLYEEESFTLIESNKLNFEFYDSNGKGLKLVKTKQDTIYTPDFIIKNNLLFPIIIETKGRKYADFLVKFKMFLSKLNNSQFQGKIFMPRNQKDVNQMISIINESKIK